MDGRLMLYGEGDRDSCIPSTEMFFPGEVEDSTSEEMVVDRFGHALSPQPRRFALEKMRFNIKPPKVPDKPQMSLDDHKSMRTGGQPRAKDSGKSRGGRARKSDSEKSGRPRARTADAENDGRERPQRADPETGAQASNEFVFDQSGRGPSHATDSDHGGTHRSGESENASIRDRTVERHAPSDESDSVPFDRRERHAPRGRRLHLRLGRSPAPPGVVLPEFCFWSERYSHSFIPQSGERLAYLRNGHLDWARQLGFEELRTPIEIKRNLGVVSYARLTKVEFVLSHLLLSLNFGDFTAKVPYPVPECPPFIASAARFQHSLDYAGGLRKGDIVQVIFQDDEVGLKNFHAKVTEPPRISPDPYNSVKVIFQDDYTRGKLQPWELVFKDEPGDEERAASALCAEISPELEEMLENEEFAEVRNCRSAQWGHACLGARCRPVDLELIAARVDNRYYVTVESLLDDIRQLVMNTEIMGRGENAAKTIAEILVPRIEELARQEGIDIAEDTGDEGDIGADD
jgi:hypothetical protein